MTAFVTRSCSLFSTAALVLTACVSTPTSAPIQASDSDLPSAEVLEEIALEIERAVLAGKREAAFLNRGGIVISDEAVLQAIRTRAARSALVVKFLKTGHAWERIDGRVWILRSGEYKRAGTRRDRDRDAVLVMGENDNRWTIYEGIVNSSGLSRRALATVEAAFAKARVELLPAGIKYEDAQREVAFTRGPG